MGLPHDVPVYIWFRSGSETYASTRAPGKVFQKALEAEGWEFFRATVRLPVELEMEEAQVTEVSTQVARESVGLPGMSDEELLSYFEWHSRTELALFSVKQLNRLRVLAGWEPIADGNDFIAVRPPLADMLVAEARRHRGGRACK